MTGHDDIRIGTLARAAEGASYIEKIIPHGFESFQIFIWQHIGDINLKALAKDVKAVLESANTDVQPVVSSLGMFGNPLSDAQTEKDFAKCIDLCEAFGCDIVAGFAGSVPGASVPDAMKRYKQVYTKLARRANDKGVRIAFENCDMGGRWEDSGNFNIAHAPTAWEMMFNEVPDECIGLCWEPCHQMVSLIDPLPQLRKWVGRVHNVHGKDATIAWDVLRTTGLRGGQTWVWHRTPGFGDTNWTDVITILRQGGYTGSIDIEGWHDPIYRGDLEMTGQVHGLNYLKA